MLVELRPGCDLLDSSGFTVLFKSREDCGDVILLATRNLLFESLVNVCPAGLCGLHLIGKSWPSLVFFVPATAFDKNYKRDGFLYNRQPYQAVEI